MSLFNNDAQWKPEPDPTALVPQPLGQPVGEPIGRNSAKTAPLHQTVGARAYLDRGSTIHGKLKFEGPVQIEGHVQ